MLSDCGFGHEDPAISADSSESMSHSVTFCVAVALLVGWRSGHDDFKNPDFGIRTLINSSDVLPIKRYIVVTAGSKGGVPNITFSMPGVAVLIAWFARKFQELSILNKTRCGGSGGTLYRKLHVCQTSVFQTGVSQ